ncbi:MULTISPECIES: hypothetical protein [unclassified Bradyrhizobium]|uniref:hypothetical protein n=1 Tax=unclassified Bradyrhizobium TaxID=2631580 RepID=UPI001FF7705C|nr:MULTISPECIES: hypothetical protein [unclassified Bradyrhizobium]MCK1508729.1 hypothetical protein [Bradyrhizobium sp. 18]UPJ79193.1 hypothetical protein IVB17_30960 [Bradyrhizobium sp. 184]UPJ86986.1 hypothetical protein IVB16_30960 [Bradyrhizobium sp. 183]
MTERAVSRAVRNARREVAPAQEGDPRLHVRIAEPKAKVLILPGRFRTPLTSSATSNSF